MDYRFGVKRLTIQELLNEFLELHDQMHQNQEDYSLSEEIGQETEQNYRLVRNEIIARTTN